MGTSSDGGGRSYRKCDCPNIKDKEDSNDSIALPIEELETALYKAYQEGVVVGRSLKEYTPDRILRELKDKFK